MTRPTIHDLAKEAGVSLATIDRVLNQRPGVRSSTIEKVQYAVKKINYVRDINAANLAKSRSYHLLFIIPEGTNSFMRGLEEQAYQQKKCGIAERIHIEIVTSPAFDAVAITKILDNVDTDKISGIAMVATEAPIVTDAINNLTNKGISIVTMVSDIPNSRRIHYVGINNIAAGRTAASLLGRFSDTQTGKIVVIAGSMLQRDHVERHLGFQQVFEKEFPHVEIMPTLHGKDSSSTVYQLLSTLLEENPDITGIYNLGAGNRGVIKALKKVQTLKKVRVVVHDLSPYVRQALHEGIFDVALGHDHDNQEISSATRILKAHLDGQVIAPLQGRIRTTLYMRDNMPDI